jgi:hypothetical protein
MSGHIVRFPQRATTDEFRRQFDEHWRKHRLAVMHETLMRRQLRMISWRRPI